MSPLLSSVASVTSPVKAGMRCLPTDIDIIVTTPTKGFIRLVDIVTDSLGSWNKFVDI
jgi:hypothetical protein